MTSIQKLLLLLATITLGIMSAPVFSASETGIYVSQSSGDFSTISEAIDSISDASKDNPYVIFVDEGTYNERVMLKPWIRLEGSGIGKTILSGHSVSLIGASNSSVSHMSVLSTSNSTHCVGLYIGGGIFSASDVEFTATGGLNLNTAVGVHKNSKVTLTRVIINSSMDAINTIIEDKENEKDSVTLIDSVIQSGSINNFEDRFVAVNTLISNDTYTTIENTDLSKCVQCYSEDYIDYATQLPVVRDETSALNVKLSSAANALLSYLLFVEQLSEESGVNYLPASTIKSIKNDVKPVKKFSQLLAKLRLKQAIEAGEATSKSELSFEEITQLSSMTEEEFFANANAILGVDLSNIMSTSFKLPQSDIELAVVDGLPQGIANRIAELLQSIQ